MEPVPAAEEVRSLNQWTPRESLHSSPSSASWVARDFPKHGLLTVNFSRKMKLF